MSLLQDTRAQIALCFNTDRVKIKEARLLQSGSGCDVIVCEFTAADAPTGNGILKIYKEGFDDYSGIGVIRTAKKVIMASSELNNWNINIPKILSYHLSKETASVLSEKVEGLEWDGRSRIRASNVLGRLHGISLSGLAAEFQELVSQSRTNKSRVRNGVIQFNKDLDTKYPGWVNEHPQLHQDAKEIIENGEPVSSMRTLVHGDYFSKNIITAADGIYIIDWDLLSIGDPMWDLGFLLAADLDVGSDESDATRAEYSKYCDIDESVLAWHRKCWQTFWRLNRLVNN